MKATTLAAVWKMDQGVAGEEENDQSCTTDMNSVAIMYKRIAHCDTYFKTLQPTRW